MNVKEKHVNQIFDAETTTGQDDSSDDESDYIETAEDIWEDIGNEDDEEGEKEGSGGANEKDDQTPKEVQGVNSYQKANPPRVSSRRKSFPLEKARKSCSIFFPFGYLLPWKLCMNIHDPKKRNDFIKLKYKLKANARRLQHYIPGLRCVFIPKGLR